MERFRMTHTAIRRGLPLVISVLLFVVSTPIASAGDSPSAPSTQAGDATTATPNRLPYVVMIHADWCGTCKGLKPVWERIQSDLAEQSTAVTFDVSDRPAYAESARAARELGVGDFFSEYRAKTGTIGILACDTQEPVAILNGERDFETYRAAIEKAACKAS